jgi:hypothetical protein
MSAPESAIETPAERLARELASLRTDGVLKKQLTPVSRSTFETLSAQSKSDYMRAGGTLVNDPEPTKAKLPSGAIRRSTFDRMTPAVKLDFINKGGGIVDDDLVVDEAKAGDSPKDE